IAVTGTQNRYTFTLPAAARLYFDSLTNNNRFAWMLTGPGGVVVSPRLFTQSDAGDISTNPVLSLAAGGYTLTVDGFGDATGPYQFRLHDLAAATPVTPGTPVSGTLDPANETDLYRFTAAAGDRFFFRVQDRTGAPGAHWRLIGPSGNIVFERSFDQDA